MTIKRTKSNINSKALSPMIDSFLSRSQTPTKNEKKNVSMENFAIKESDDISIMEEKIVAEIMGFDPTINCPVCSVNLIKLSLKEREAHVETCLAQVAIDLDSTDVSEVIDLTHEPSSSLRSSSFHSTKQIKGKGKEEAKYKHQSTTKRSISSTKTILKSRKPKKEKGKEEAKYQSTMKRSISPTKRLISPTKTNSSKRPKKEKVIPDYKTFKIGGKIFAVDAFCYGNIPGVDAYFLTHFHADHYMGLTKSWKHGQIYCSEITARLVALKLRIDHNWVTPLAMNKEYDIFGVKTTLIDANHCPGAAIILFEADIRILHTGDFRACADHINNLKLYDLPIDNLYLDTTYVDPKYIFPNQQLVIDSSAEFCKKLNDGQITAKKSQRRLTDFFYSRGYEKHKKGLLIAVGTYTIGKEKLAMGIAKKLGTKIYVKPDKHLIVNSYESKELNSFLTSNPYEAQVHLVTMRNLTEECLEDYYKQYQNQFSNITAFKPTGWSFTSQWKKGPELSFNLLKDIIENGKTIFKCDDLEAQYKPSKVFQIYSVPYSEHSSFRELCLFCLKLDIKKITPTVNMESSWGRQLNEALIHVWSQYKETFKDFITVDSF